MPWVGLRCVIIVFPDQTNLFFETAQTDVNLLRCTHVPKFVPYAGYQLSSSNNSMRKLIYSKTCVKRPLSKRPKIDFKTNYRSMQVISIAECSKGSILQYFRPSISYHLSLRSLFCLFLSCRFTQVLLYVQSAIGMSPCVFAQSD